MTVSDNSIQADGVVSFSNFWEEFLLEQVKK